MPRLWRSGGSGAGLLMGSAPPSPVDVRLVGWDAPTGLVFDVAVLGVLAFAVVLVALVAAASLTILTRRGS